VGGERAKERANERGRGDVSGRGEQEKNVCTAKRPPSWLLRAASKSSGWVSALAALPCPALPCPCPALSVTENSGRVFALPCPALPCL